MGITATGSVTNGARGTGKILMFSIIDINTNNVYNSKYKIDRRIERR